MGRTALVYPPVCRQFSRGFRIATLLALPLHAFRGILEGDTEVDLYINGVYVRADKSRPVLPLNGERRYETARDPAYIIYQDNPFEEDDVLGMHVKSKNPLHVPVTLANFAVKIYPAWSAAIAAFEDGILTNEQWRCTEKKEPKWSWKKFIDVHWPFAVVQDTSCCPWRDPSSKWKRLNSKWIGPMNASAREFFCRYKVRKGQTIMDGSTLTASNTAPQINVSSLDLGTSVASVSYIVSKPSTMYCMLLDSRFQLRPPSPLEIESFGSRKDIDGWIDVTVGNYRHHYSHPALAWHTFGNVADCQRKCLQYTAALVGGPCSAITFFTFGTDPTTGANCKLMHHLDNANLLIGVSFPTARVMHMAMRTFPVEDTVGIAGLLFPGTVYSSYCSARDFVTNKHSTWDDVQRTKLTMRTPGCFDCGEKVRPYVRILGGYASNYAFTAVVWSSQPGRVFCGAKAMASSTTPFSLTQDAIKESSIKKSQHFSLIPKAGASSQLTVKGLQPLTLHELACMAESDAGGESDLANLEDSRRRWWTENVSVPIWSMAISFLVLPGDPPVASLAMRLRMSVIGYIWCQKYVESTTKEDGIPTVAVLKTKSFRIKLTDPKTEVSGIFNDVLHNESYQVFCSGAESDFRNDGDWDGEGLPPDYPEAKVMEYSSNEGDVKLDIRVQRGPATTYCRPYRWPRRPFSSRPPPPPIASLRASPFRGDTMTMDTGVFVMLLSGLASGSLYDLYCYAEEWLPPPPPGAVEPPRRGMTLPSIRNTRITIKTEGPSYRDLGWTCVAGHPCKVSDIEGDGLTSLDKVIVQGNQCPGRCQCNGLEDLDRKGATCSAVSHDRGIRAPDPMYNGLEAVDRVDPFGRWCYVTQGNCFDGSPSPTFPWLVISYAACSFQNSTVGIPGTGPAGFPDMGIGRLASSAADAYTFGTGPMLAGGKPYHLCWCNGTESLCRSVSDYRLRIGILHLAGPSAEQQTRVMPCIAGMPCILDHFKGHGLANGNRLVVMPVTSLGCRWFRETPGDPISTPGMPNTAVSLPATVGGTSFSWGPDNVRAGGGFYLLCWCGSTLGAHHTLTPACPVPRPEKGDHYLAPAGYLSIIGPATGDQKRHCNVGIECKLEGIQGNGLEGGDRVSILKECGRAVPAPEDWASGAPGSAELPENWILGGWLLYGPVLSSAVLESSGGPIRASISRGAWGMPHHGISLTSPQKGFFSWGAPSQNAPGDYSLCWCAARVECTRPEHFQVLVNPIRFVGPAVLPSASQARICVRNRQCEILNYTGVWAMSGGQLFIASGRCGISTAALGAPRKGISYTAPDGNSFRWGKETIRTPAGKYRLCWCFQAFACTQPEEFGSFAGILRVKQPFGPLRTFWCTIGFTCMIEDVHGEASGPSDRVMAMSVCGDGLGSDAFEERGVSQETGPDGLWFRLPKAITAGRFRVCWCAGETLCSAGRDYDHDLGELVVGGPDASAVYLCYEWEPCTLSGLLGTDLHDGDRLFTISTSMNCSMPNLTTHPLYGWPLGGWASYGYQGGSVFSWGGDKVRVSPGIYSLCWCGIRNAPGGVCNETALFDVPAGQIRIGTSKEFMFATRKKDPEPRSMDMLYGLLLIGPLALAACSLGFLGWRKVNTKTNKIEHQAPHPFPKKKAWAQAEQDKLRLNHSVKQIKAQRELAVGTLDACAKDNRLIDIETPNFTGNRKLALANLLQDIQQNAKKQKALMDIEDNPVEDKKHSMASNYQSESSLKKVRSQASIPNAQEADDQQPAGLGSSHTLGGPSWKAARSLLRKASTRIRRSRTAPVLEVRGIQEPTSPGVRSRDLWSEEPPSPTSPTRSRPGGEAWRREIETGPEDLAGGLGPASPTALWSNDWDVEDDGPMPPSMEFYCNSDNRRRDVLLKILDM